jgi:hypothetical protein
MKYTIYEDPLTHKFAFLPLPNRFVDGDELPLIAIDRWFGSREEAIAALPELLNRDESEPCVGLNEGTWIDDGRSG